MLFWGFVVICIPYMLFHYLINLFIFSLLMLISQGAYDYLIFCFLSFYFFSFCLVFIFILLLFIFIFSFVHFFSITPILSLKSSFNPLLKLEPSAPPQDISCTSPSSTSILVSWKPPPVENQNGIITAYSIKYIEIDGEDVKPHEILGISSDSTQYLLEQLEKWTEYRISVTAHTDVGPGPESLAVLIRTDEDGMLPPLHESSLDLLCFI